MSRRREGGSARGDGGEEEGLDDSDGDGDGERDDDDDEDDDRDEDEDEDEEEEQEEEEEEEAVAVDDGRVRPDPRMKKHLSKAVKIGHKIIWGYQPRPKNRVRRHQVRAMLCVRLSEHYQGWLTLLSSPCNRGMPRPWPGRPGGWARARGWGRRRAKAVSRKRGAAARRKTETETETETETTTTNLT